MSDLRAHASPPSAPSGTGSVRPARSAPTLGRAGARHWRSFELKASVELIVVAAALLWTVTVNRGFLSATTASNGAPAGAAFAVGILVQRYLVAYWELVLGLPAILATYGIVLWYRGFEEEDRLLFAGRDKLLKDAER